MRILVLSNLYPSALHPAFGTFVAARVDALRAAGAQVDVVAIHDPAAGRRVALKYGSLGLRSLAYVTRSRTRGQVVDVVEGHIAFPTGLVAKPVARLLGAPLVLFAHGADVLDVPQRGAIHLALARRTYDSARLIVANSDFLAGEFSRRFPGAAERLVVQSPGIDLDRFRGSNHDLGQRRGVLFVGRLIPEKGASTLLRAMASIAPDGRPVPLRVMGGGPERRALEALAARLALDVTFSGPVRPDVVAETMRSSAVVVVPSVYREPLGLVAIEGMAAGAIVVASATGGLMEIVTDEQNGLVVPPGDVGALAAAISHGLAIAADPVVGPRVRMAALDTAATHDVRRIANESLRLYGTLRS